MLSELADILAAVEAESVDTTAAADERGGAGPDVAMAALSAAVHLLQWDQPVVSTASGKMGNGTPGPSVAGRWYPLGRFGVRQQDKTIVRVDGE